MNESKRKLDDVIARWTTGELDSQQRYDNLIAHGEDDIYTLIDALRGKNE